MMLHDPLFIAVVFAVINLAVVYAAAFPFQLSWYAVLGVVVAMSMSIRVLNNMFFSDPTTRPLFLKILYASAVALVSAFLLLLVLSARFGFPLAFAIVALNAVLHGGINYFS